MKSLRRFQNIPKQEDVGRRLYLLKLLWLLLLLLVRRNILVDTRLATQAFQIILLTEQLAQIYRCVCVGCAHPGQHGGNALGRLV